MTRIIVLAVLVAGLALVLFAERLGIPAALAALLVLSLVGAAVVLTAILSGTSRLPVFLVSEGADRMHRLVLRHALLMAGGALVLASVRSFEPFSLLILIGAYLVGVALCPRYSVHIKTRSPVPLGLRRDEAGLLTFAIGLIAGVGVLALGPQVFQLAGGALAVHLNAAVGMPLVLTAILLLPGGNRVTLRLISMAVLLAILFIFLPFLLEILRDASGWRSILQDPMQRAGWQALIPAIAVSPSEIPVPAVIGLALGLIGAVGHASVLGRVKRCTAPLLGVVVLCLTIFIVAAALLMLERVIALSMAGVQPQNWPLFAFEEALRGWLSLCGRAPVDALDVVQACRTAGIGLPVSREAISVDPDLRAPAIAAARGLPIMLGVVWLAIGLIALLALQMLFLSTAATAFSEVILFRLLHPRALKAWRLVAARLSILMLAAGAILLQRADVVTSELLLFLGLSALLLVACVLVAHVLRRLVVWRNARSSKEWPAPANENTALEAQSSPPGVVKG